MKERPIADEGLKPDKRLFLITKATTILSNFWKTGKIYGELPEGLCDEYFEDLQWDSSPYFNCNPYLFQCLFEGKFTRTLRVNHSGKEYEIEAHTFGDDGEYFRLLSLGTVPGLSMEVDAVQLRISIKGDKPSKTYDLLFDNTCHMRSLPLRRYIHGTVNYSPNPKTNDLAFWTWDNIGRDIFVDQYQVNFRDIKLWIDSVEVGDKPFVDIPKDPKDWKNPAHGLSVDQMRRFCQSKGKQMMMSSIYDATMNFAAFVKKPYRETPMRTWHPWGIRQNDHFLRKSFDSNDYRFLDAKNCNQVYSKECAEKYKHSSLPLSSPGWMGVTQQYGGYMEVVRNALHPNKNIFPSSFYLPMNSDWHENGVRGSWTGTDSLFSNFSFEGSLYNELEQVNNIKVGFRCYKDMPGEF